jgi:hypothetical protein
MVSIREVKERIKQTQMNDQWEANARKALKRLTERLIVILASRAIQKKRDDIRAGERVAELHVEAAFANFIEQMFEVDNNG